MNAQGKVHKYGDNVDTDVIIPARYLNTADHKELASHCMEDIDKDFISKVKEGVLTMCRLAFEDGKYVMHMVVGEGVNPGKWEEAGWAQPAPQLPGLKVLLKDTEDFADKVMCQHYIISYGDNSKLIKDFCTIAGIEII